MKTWFNKIWPDKYRIVRLSRWIETFWRFSRSYSRFSNAWNWEVKIGGRYVPWINYPAIEFLDQIDLSSKDIFEYGAGSSTIYFASKQARVISVESKPEWAAKVQNTLWKEMPDSRSMVHLRTCPIKYLEFIDTQDRKFDVILIDGEIKNSCRFHCAEKAVNHLKEDGFIILDNADWCPLAYKKLLDLFPIAIPFKGFAPLVPYSTTTVFFFASVKGLLRVSNLVRDRYSKAAIVQNLEK